MRTYVVEGTYKGKVQMKVRAENFTAAAKAFELDCNEDEVEILEHSKIIPNMATMREIK